MGAKLRVEVTYVRTWDGEGGGGALAVLLPEYHYCYCSQSYDLFRKTCFRNMRCI